MKGKNSEGFQHEMLEGEDSRGEMLTLRLFKGY